MPPHSGQDFLYHHPPILPVLDIPMSPLTLLSCAADNAFGRQVPGLEHKAPTCLLDRQEDLFQDPPTGSAHNWGERRGTCSISAHATVQSN